MNKKIHVSTKITFRVIITFVLILAGFLLLSQYFLVKFKDNLIKLRKHELKNISELAFNVVKPIIKDFKTGKINEEQARKDIVKLVRRMRYMDIKSKGYIFAGSFKGVSLAMPYRHDLEGKNQWNIKDYHGKYIVRNLVKIAKSTKGKGFYSYHFPPPGESIPQLKISYVIGIKSLKMYIGTGMHTQDIDGFFNKYFARALALATGIIFSVFLLIYLFLNKFIRGYSKITKVLDNAFVSYDQFPDIDLDNYKKNSELWHLLNSFKLMIERINVYKEKYKISQNFLETAVNQSPAGIIIVEKETETISLANKKAKELITGSSIEKDVSILTNKYNSYFSLSDVDKNVLEEKDVPIYKALYNCKATKNFEAILKVDKNEDKYVLVNTAPISNDKGEVIACVVVLIDISEKKYSEREKELLIRKLEEALDEAHEAVKFKQELISILSHEIRTPLTGIIGFAQLLEKRTDLDDASENMVKHIVKSSFRLNELLTNLLDLSVLQSGKEIIPDLQEIDLEEMLDGIFTLFENRIKEYNNSIEYNVNLKNSLISDKLRLQQILYNLVSNATKFTSYGKILIEVTEEKHRVLFKVKDTGIGIAEKDISKIFDIFKQLDSSLTRRYQGVGIGLSLSKEFVELLGGEIWVESEVNKGSTFYFTLPTSGKEEKLEINSNEKNKTDKNDVKETNEDFDNVNTVKNKNLKILFAEDDELNFRLLKRLLFYLGIEDVEGFNNGIDILNRFKENQDADLIILDIQMPGKNGIETLKEIRKFNKKIPVVALSAFTMDIHKDNFLKEGFAAFLGKPIVEKELIKILNSL